MSEETPLWQRPFYPLLRLIRRLRALRDSQHQFQLLVDGAADYAIFMLSPRGVITSWSIAAEKIFGYTGQDVIGQHYKLLYPGDIQTAQNIERQLIIAIAHGRFEEVSLRLRKDGTQFWANTVVCPLHDSRGKLQGYSNVTRDISERKQAEAALEKKEKELQEARKIEAIGRLAGGVAHDFNNLMTGIIGMSQELYDETLPEDAKREDLMEIIKAAKRAAALTKQLLAFGRRSTAAPQVVNINDIIVDMSPILRRLVGPEIELKMALTTEGGHLKIDPTHIEQIVINLVMNARDALPQGGQIRVETSRVVPNAAYRAAPRGWGPGPQIALIVSDTGIGMTEETRSHIFEPFYTTKAQEKGTGLGLTTVQGIVKQNNGEISVQSKLGEGSTFKILFPEIDQRAAVSST